jgi:hypothetical protein
LYYQSQYEQKSIPSPIPTAAATAPAAATATGGLLPLRSLENSCLIIKYRLMGLLDTRGSISRWESTGVNGSIELQDTIFIYLFIYLFIFNARMSVQAQTARVTGLWSPTLD